MNLSMSTQRYAVIVECSSNGRFYIPEARRRGLRPLVIYPHLPDSPYTAMRAHTRDELEKDIPVIDAPEDMDALIKLLEPYPIACVLAGSEYGVAMADELARRLGLPGNAPETSYVRLEKPSMQEALRKAGIRYIRSRTVTSLEEAEAFWRELGEKRVVVKPLASAGTVGVHFCSDLQQLQQHVRALLADKDLFGRTIEAVMIQEYIDGTEYIVNTVSCNGVHRMTDLWMYNKVAIGSEGNAYDYARLMTRLEPGHRALIEYAYQVLDALGYTYGPSHGEYMVDEEGPVLIEAGARPMGGGFSMDLLDACLGHHLTDCAMDSYLNPERFEEARLAPYRPAMEMMIKYFIAPRRQDVFALPALALLKHLKSFRRVNLTDVLQSGMLEKTVDLLSAPAFLQLCHPDLKVVMQDYQTIRQIEQKDFGLLFAEGGGEKSELDVSQALEAYRSLPEGERFMLLDDEEECRRMRAYGVTAVTPDTLEALPGERVGGVFALSSVMGLEDCLDMVPSFVKKLRSGGIMRVMDRSYRGFPCGSAGYEWMMRLMDVELQAPLYGQSSILTGLLGGASAVRSGELIQTDWFVRVKDDQWLLPERRASQEGIEICERLGIGPGAKVYDCPCGDARISYQMALCGADVTGMDINPRFVKQAKERFQALGIAGRFTVGDMRNASYPGGCDVFLNWFNSFGYFSEEENQRHMRAMADCIRPGGFLLLEGPNPSHIIDNVKTKYEQNPAEVQQQWDESTRRMNITYPPEGEGEAVVVSIRIYDLEEYRALFQEAGLVLEESFGEHFRPLTQDSMRMILVARKPA